LTTVNAPNGQTVNHRHMRCRTIIPIQPAPVRLRSMPPLFSGDPSRVQRVVSALQVALGEQAGLHEPLEAWLRELHLSDDEAELSLAPGLPCCGMSLAQAAFDTLRGLLPDTDIYVRTSAM
jgi:hypothetical protein